MATLIITLFNRVKISDFEIRILCSIKRCPPHSNRVLTQSHLLCGGSFTVSGRKFPDNRKQNVTGSGVITWHLEWRQGKRPVALEFYID
jgi:hypothetical protein